MKPIDLVQEYTRVNAFTPVSIAAGTAGASIDLRNYAGGGTIEVNVAAGGGNVTFKLTESVDNVTFTDVTAISQMDGVLPSQLVNAGNVAAFRLDPANLKRYVKIFGTPSAAAVVAGVGILKKTYG